MKILRILITAMILGACLTIGYYFWMAKPTDQSFVIRDFNYDRDHQAIEDLFNKGDNFYWMYKGPSNTYSIDFMLKYNTSSQHSKNRDLTLKVATVHGKIAGFLAYHSTSLHVWKLLFLIVDQDFRRQGIARKLLDFAIHDMVRRGALQVILGTRNNNFKAQNLYKGYGFQLINEEDNGFIWLSWHKPTP